MRWRVLPLEQHDAFTNMALDEAIMECMASGDAEPTIRFYTWKPSAVSIGRFQSLNDEINVDQCKELGVDFVRRLTGGGAVYHDEEGEITYSIIAPEKLFPKGIHESYGEICGYVIDGLAELGINASFAPINDILLNGKKISGNAQTRKQGVLLQHGTILYRTNVAKMFSLLQVSKEKLSDKMIKSAEERVTSVTASKDVSLCELYTALLHGFTKGKKFEFGVLSYKEVEMIKTLHERYRSSSWNFMR